jgi:nucleotide-binding universal stress UspA family protein
MHFCCSTMYTKIICPTDFSQASYNAIEYAAKLAQVFWCELVLVHIEKVLPVSFHATYDINPGPQVLERSRNASDALRRLSEDINKKFHISSRYEVEITGKRLAKAIAGGEDDKVLFVTGTQGAENLFENVFGTHSFRLVKETYASVLIVPENYNYQTVSKVLFVITDENAGALALEKLNDYIDKFHVHLNFLNTGGVETYEHCRKQVNIFFKDRLIDVDFWNKHSRDIRSVLEELAGDRQFDLIVMQEPEKTMLQQFLYVDPVKKLSALLEMPLLVLHQPKRIIS